MTHAGVKRPLHLLHTIIVNECQTLNSRESTASMFFESPQKDYFTPVIGAIICQ